MDSLQVKSEQSSPPSAFYTWEVPGKPVVVHLDYLVVDRMLIEVMRGFGAIPRRGAEVGGILLGTMENQGDHTLVRIEEFEPVGCEHRRGPSYLLSEGDTARFSEALERNQYSPERKLYAVGCYRSHTRDGLALSPEDMEQWETYFPDPHAVFLLIKPYATRVSVAGFFFRETDGTVQAGQPYLEFPFRRRELGGGSPPPGRPREQAPLPAAAAPSAYTLRDDGPVYEDYPAGDYLPEEPTWDDAGGETWEPRRPAPAESSAVARFRRGNVWIPLSFLFLLIGTLIGFQAALSYKPVQANPSDPFSLSLAAARSGDYLHVRWDRNAAAVKAAQRGVLTITEAGYEKKVDLDALQLQNPTVYYRNLTDRVQLHLEIYTKERVTVAESADWRR